MCVVQSTSLYGDNQFFFEEKLVKEINGKEIPFIIVGLKNRVGITCGYVGFHKDIGHIKKLRENISEIECHGGITFNDELVLYERLEWMKICGDDFFWIGWDYGHAGDFIPSLVENGKKYDPIDIKNECHYVIKQLIDIVTK